MFWLRNKISNFFVKGLFFYTCSYLHLIFGTNLHKTFKHLKIAHNLPLVEHLSWYAIYIFSCSCQMLYWSRLLLVVKDAYIHHDHTRSIIQNERLFIFNTWYCYILVGKYMIRLHFSWSNFYHKFSLLWENSINRRSLVFLSVVTFHAFHTHFTDNYKITVTTHVKTAWKKFREATTISHIPRPLLQDPWPCIQLLLAERHAPCQWNLATDIDEPAAQWQGHDQTDLQYQARRCGHGWEREGFAGLGTWSVLVVQSEQHVIYRLMAGGGQRGPS